MSMLPQLLSFTAAKHCTAAGAFASSAAAVVDGRWAEVVLLYLYYLHAFAAQ